MVVETTDENVAASLDKTNQALELFRQADDRFAQAADRYPAADFSPYRTYLAKRIEACLLYTSRCVQETGVLRGCRAGHAAFGDAQGQG